MLFLNFFCKNKMTVHMQPFRFDRGVCAAVQRRSARSFECRRSQRSFCFPAFRWPRCHYSVTPSSPRGPDIECGRGTRCGADTAEPAAEPRCRQRAVAVLAAPRAALAALAAVKALRTVRSPGRRCPRTWWTGWRSPRCAPDGPLAPSASGAAAGSSLPSGRPITCLLVCR